MARQHVKRNEGGKTKTHEEMERQRGDCVKTSVKVKIGSPVGAGAFAGTDRSPITMLNAGAAPVAVDWSGGSPPQVDTLFL